MDDVTCIKLWSGGALSWLSSSSSLDIILPPFTVSSRTSASLSAKSFSYYCPHLLLSLPPVCLPLPTMLPLSPAQIFSWARMANLLRGNRACKSFSSTRVAASDNEFLSTKLTAKFPFSLYVGLLYHRGNWHCRRGPWREGKEHNGKQLRHSESYTHQPILTTRLCTLAVVKVTLNWPLWNLIT